MYGAHDDDPMPQRRWAIVDHQADALVKSGLLLGKTKTVLPSLRKGTSAPVERKRLLAHEFHARVEAAFEVAAGNDQYMAASCDIFHQCLSVVCRSCGVPCPSEEDIELYLSAVVPGTELGQVISLPEFVDGARHLCPDLFLDFEKPRRQPQGGGHPRKATPVKVGPLLAFSSESTMRLVCTTSKTHLTATPGTGSRTDTGHSL